MLSSNPVSSEFYEKGGLKNVNMTRQRGKKKEIFMEASCVLGPKLDDLCAFFFKLNFQNTMAEAL